LLRTLHAGNVVAIVVDGQQIARAPTVAAIVAALNKCEPFSTVDRQVRSNPRVRVVIKVSTGEPIAFRARRDKLRGGAVVEFETWSGRGEDPDKLAGAGLQRCRALPAALKAAGVPMRP
jgi:hypothetical protein